MLLETAVTLTTYIPKAARPENLYVLREMGALVVIAIGVSSLREQGPS